MNIDEFVNQVNPESQPAQSSDVEAVTKEIATLPTKTFKVVMDNVNLDKLSEAISSISKVEGKNGIDGKDGKTPTNQELIKIIKPLIPVAKPGKDGKTPSASDLLKLIRPLIPIVKDGETPSDERLISLIKPLIPKVPDIKAPTKKELEAMILPLIPAPIAGKDGKDGQTGVMMGSRGYGVEKGGTTGQVLAKKSTTDYDTEWVNQSGGGAGVSSIVAGSGISVNSTDPANPIVTATGSGTGDMLKATYDPTSKLADAFSQDNMASGTTNKNYTATEQTKLAGIATGATANSSDATLLARANHTGTQLASTISDFSTATAATAAVTANTAKVTNATHTGDATGATALTLATVNANVGSFGSATQVPGYTVNGKGLITAASNTTIQIAESQVTNLTTDLTAKLAKAGDTMSGQLQVSITGASASDSTIKAIVDTSTANQPAILAQNNTNFAHTGGIAKLKSLNATDSGAVIRIENAGTGKNISSANGTTETFSVDKAGVVVGGAYNGNTIGAGSTSGANTGDNATNTQYSGLSASKQDVLVSGTNIKTINSTSLLGSGDIAISGGSGDVVGPAGATGNAIARYNGTTGKLIQDSGVTISTGVSPTIASTGLNLNLAAGTGSVLIGSSEITTAANTQTLTNKTLTSPTLTTPTLGVAAATSINKVAITAPATASTLTIADGKTLTTNNSITLAGTDATTMTFPSTSDTVAGLAAVQTVTGAWSFNDAKLILKGATSGTTTLKSGAVAGTSVITLPIATDTLVGKATIDNLTNKSFSVATGTQPFAVTSTTKVTNLNADYVDGFQAAATATANQLLALDSNAIIQAALPIKRQNITTNTAPAGMRIETGWGYMLGNATATMSQAVTFNTAFSGAPIVTVSFAGYNSSVPTTNLSNLTDNNTYILNGQGISTTGFTTFFNRASGTYLNTLYYIYNWIAIGA